MNQLTLTFPIGTVVFYICFLISFRSKTEFIAPDADLEAIFTKQVEKENRPNYARPVPGSRYSFFFFLFSCHLSICNLMVRSIYFFGEMKRPNRFAGHVFFLSFLFFSPYPE